LKKKSEAEKPLPSFRERAHELLINLAYVGPIAVISFAIGWARGGGESGWNAPFLTAITILDDLLISGVYLLLGIISLKTLWFLQKEWRAGRSYLIIHFKYSFVFEVIFCVILLGGAGSFFMIIALSRIYLLIF